MDGEKDLGSPAWRRLGWGEEDLEGLNSEFRSFTHIVQAIRGRMKGGGQV